LAAVLQRTQLGDHIINVDRVGVAHDAQERGLDEQALVEGVTDVAVVAEQALDEALDDGGAGADGERLQLVALALTKLENLLRLLRQLHDHDAAQVAEHVGVEPLEVPAVVSQMMDAGHDAGSVVGKQCDSEVVQLCAGGEAKDVDHIRFMDARGLTVAAAESDHLVECRLGVTHATFSGPCEDGERVVSDVNRLVVSDMAQPLDDRRYRDPAQVKALTP
jgi:hypothetical protein